MRALLSVWDKAGLVELATALDELGWELVSSGGTASALRAAGVPVTEVAEVTAAPEMLGGRVKTLHPAIHGGILADRSNPSHVDDLAARGIEPIDLVVCNLYPFRSDPSVEMIDIGGPAMVRAAAKNFASVGVVVRPDDYGAVVDELRSDGRLSEATRRRLARTAFAHTAAYDAAVVGWFDGAEADGALAPTLHLALERRDDLPLRYGENPHQQGAFYRQVGDPSWWDGVTQHSGMGLSYLNLYDADAAWRVVHDLAAMSGRAAAVIVKHANPCGAAVAGSLADAYQRAYDGDPRSAFGGIVALSEPVDGATAERMVAAAQADVVIAPGYDDGVVDALRARRKNTRVLSAPPPDPLAVELRQVSGGWLAQEPHRYDAGRGDWRVVTKVAPTEEQWADVELAWRLVGHVRSNAIVLVRDGMAVGIGAGQQNRVEAGQLAASKAAGRAAGGACASDAFYPFPDGVEAAAEAGAAVVVQPGGAMRDEDVIAAADRLGLAMVFTGERHFLH